MRKIKSWDIFIEEVKLGDISKFNIDPNNKDSIDVKNRLTYKNLEDSKFRKLITTKKYYKGKKIQWSLNWYHDTYHDLIRRISKRTSIKTISEFNDIFSNTINKLLPDYLISGEINKSGRYSIYLNEYNISLIIYLNIIKFEITTISIINGINYDKCLKLFDF